MVVPLRYTLAGLLDQWPPMLNGFANVADEPE